MQSYPIKTVLFIGIFVLAGITVCPGGNATAGNDRTEVLPQLIREGLSQNQEMKSLALKVQALKAEIGFAGSLDDPRVGIGLLNLPTDTFKFDQEPMTQKQLFIAQKFPWFGKLDLRSKRAAAKVMRQEAVLNAQQLALARQIADTYYELGFTIRRQEINQRLSQLVTQLLRVSETRYAAGKGMQSDVLQAQVELSRLLDERTTLQRMERTLADRLNALINREEFKPVAVTGTVAYPDFNLDPTILLERALKSNPELLFKRAEIDAAKIEQDLARKDYWPDMDVKLAYGQRDENDMGTDLADFASASVTFNIPLWQKSRQDNKLLSKSRQHQAALRSYQSRVKALPHQIDALVNEIRTTLENYKIYKEALLIQAKQWTISSLAAYQVDKVEFNTMINAHIRLVRLELKADQYLFDVYRKHAALEELVGDKPWEREKEKGS